MSLSLKTNRHYINLLVHKGPARLHPSWGGCFFQAGLGGPRARFEKINPGAKAKGRPGSEPGRPVVSVKCVADPASDGTAANCTESVSVPGDFEMLRVVCIDRMDAGNNGDILWFGIPAR